MPYFSKFKSATAFALLRQQLAQWGAQHGGLSWRESREQYCHGRLDATHPTAGWLRLKHYTNGTVYAEASSNKGLNFLLEALGQQAVTESSTSNASISQAQDFPKTGSDESGKGDYFGPLVVAAVRIDTPEQALALRRLGVADSKQLDDAMMLRIAPKILDYLPPTAVSIVCWLPADYNQHYERYNNLNHLLAAGHAQAIAEILQPVDASQPVQILIDQFAANPAVMKQALAKQGVTRPFVQRPRAEADVAVATASVLARCRFLQSIAQLEQQAGCRLPLGAGSPVLQAARKLKHQPEQLRQLAKWHFKTTTQL